MYKFAYDVNFKLSPDFLSNFAEASAYEDLDLMIMNFEKGMYDIIFLPVGSLIYLSQDYQVIAQACLESSPKQKMSSSIYSKKPIEFDQITKSKIGFVNKHCTTSFWALLIELKKNRPTSTSLKLSQTFSFENLVKGLIDDKFDFAMIWDKVLPNEALKLNCFFTATDLPTPIFISRKKIDSNFLNFLQHYQETKSSGYFESFSQPQLKNIDDFLKNMSDVKDYFKIT